MQLSDLQVGTKLKNSRNEEFKILAVIGDLIAYRENQYNVVCWTTFDNLIQFGFTLASPVRWKPKYSEVYWYIDTNGKIYQISWGGGENDELTYKFGNVYKTEPEASARRDQIYKLNQE